VDQITWAAIKIWRLASKFWSHTSNITRRASKVIPPSSNQILVVRFGNYQAIGQNFLADLDDIRAKMPFMIKMATKTKRTLPKMGDKSRAFVHKALEVATQHQDPLPRSFNLEEMNRDVILFDAVYAVPYRTGVGCIIGPYICAKFHKLCIWAAMHRLGYQGSCLTQTVRSDQGRMLSIPLR
jgi:hypothetical protein